MARVDTGINCLTCKYFQWIHYTSKFIDFCDFFEEALPTNMSKDDLIKSGVKLLICKNFKLHAKFDNDLYSNLIAQYITFKEICPTLKDKMLFSYFPDNFCLNSFQEFGIE
ncbi:MAG TPA: hypothetical protein VMV49_14575 [Candidatus Deferrimicrobium sp.]|nr:hypothetical protein [Candidatus Deferrimicrobium sp.]